MGMMPKMKRFRVVGIFHSGMYEYDNTMAYISIESAQKFFGMGDRVTGIEVKTGDVYKVKEIGREIRRKLGYPFWTKDWMEMNRNLFSALRLEKIAMFIILVLIVLVAAFNIISTLIMVVMEKNKDIAILKSMGASPKGILKIFMIEGLVIGVVGTTLGAIFGPPHCLESREGDGFRGEPLRVQDPGERCLLHRQAPIPSQSSRCLDHHRNRHPHQPPGNPLPLLEGLQARPCRGIAI